MWLHCRLTSRVACYYCCGEAVFHQKCCPCCPWILKPGGKRIGPPQGANSPDARKRSYMRSEATYSWVLQRQVNAVVSQVTVVQQKRWAVTSAQNNLPTQPRSYTIPVCVLVKVLVCTASAIMHYTIDKGAFPLYAMACHQPQIPEQPSMDASTRHACTAVNEGATKLAVHQTCFTASCPRHQIQNNKLPGPKRVPYFV